jgi:hypothetical protein
MSNSRKSMRYSRNNFSTKLDFRNYSLRVCSCDLSKNS